VILRYIKSCCLFLALALSVNDTYSQKSSQAEFNLTDQVFKAAFDGSDQRYVELLPKDFQVGSPYDLMIGLHGHGSDRWQFATGGCSECQAFRTTAAKNKMIAVSPDYRARTSWMGPAAEADMIQMIGKLRNKYAIRKVYLIGGSMGGTSALTFAALHPELIDGVTAMNGHANHLEYENFQFHIAESFGGSKAAIPEEYKKRSAEYWPEKLIMPIAITVGELDKSVPPDSVIRLAATLKKIGRSVMLINHPLGGHSTSFYEAMSAMEFMISH